MAGSHRKLLEHKACMLLYSSSSLAGFSYSFRTLNVCCPALAEKCCDSDA